MTYDMSIFNDAAPTEHSDGKKAQTKQRGRGKPQYSNPVHAEARAEAVKAAGDKTLVGGDKKRTTILIRLDQLDDMDRVGSEIGISRNGFVQWGIDLALEAAANGAVPPMEDVVRRRYRGPE
ncbi:MAG: hypothetical protein E6R03_14470 [Hyphomicrobiaceae bacterium]|nr:MAG: hypothetical protein E6R03_14470 [Hyphomicrobiaceae bacterium]